MKTTIKNRTVGLLFVFLISVSFSAAEGDFLEEALEFIDQSRDRDIRGDSSLDEFVIANHTPEVIEGMFQLVEEEGAGRFWSKAYLYLGFIAEVEPASVDYRRLTRSVLKLEDYDFDSSSDVLILYDGYVAIGRFGFQKSNDFLNPRIEGVIPHDKVPVYSSTHHSGLSVTDNVATMALKAITVLMEPDALEYVDSLDKVVTQDQWSLLEKAIEQVTSEGRKQLWRDTHRNRLKFYAKLKKEQETSLISVASNVPESSQTPLAVASDHGGDGSLAPRDPESSPVSGNGSSRRLPLLLGIISVASGLVVLKFLRR